MRASVKHLFLELHHQLKTHLVFGTPSQLFQYFCLIEIEDYVQFAHVSEVLVQRNTKMMDHFKSKKLIVVFINTDNEI